MAIYELEQRIFYDAALPADVAEAGDDTAADTASQPDGAAENNDTNDTQPDNVNEHNDSDANNNNPNASDEAENQQNNSNEDNDPTVDDIEQIDTEALEDLGNYGNGVDIDGDTAVVSSGGNVYVFKYKDGVWTRFGEISDPDGGDGDFGSSVAINDGVIVIGDAGDDENGQDSGAVYVYEKDGKNWEVDDFTDPIKITSGTQGAAGDHFGGSVDVDDSGNIVIGAAYDDDYGQDAGAAYHFSYDNGWSDGTKLYADDTNANDHFGWDVAIDGDGETIVVGSPGADGSGAAYVFDQYGGEWGVGAKFNAENGQTNDYFGSSVAIDNDVIVIGSPGENNDAGAAYVYKMRDGEWNSERIDGADEGVDEGDHFGSDVDIYGSKIAIGSAGYDDGEGAVFTYNAGHLAEGGTKYTSDTSSALPGLDGDSDDFGSSVAIDKDHIIIDADSDTTDSAYSVDFGGGGGGGGEEDSGDTDTEEDDTTINDDTDEGDGTEEEFDEEEEKEEEEEEEEDEEKDDDEVLNDEDEDPNNPDQGSGNTDGGYDIGQITPPGNTGTIVHQENNGVQYFNVQNMDTSFALPNGEYNANIRTQANANAREAQFESEFQNNIFGREGAVNPQGAQALDTDMGRIDQQSANAANAIVDNFANSVRGPIDLPSTNQMTSFDSGDSGQSMDQMINNFFLSDSDSRDDDLEGGFLKQFLGTDGSSEDFKNPAFKDSIDKTIDSLIEQK